VAKINAFRYSQRYFFSMVTLMEFRFPESINLSVKSTEHCGAPRVPSTVKGRLTTSGTYRRGKTDRMLLNKRANNQSEQTALSSKRKNKQMEDESWCLPDSSFPKSSVFYINPGRNSSAGSMEMPSLNSRSLPR
jgi:hypothetical protein